MIDTTAIVLIEQCKDAYTNGLEHGKRLQEQIALQVQNWEAAMLQNLGLTRDSIFNILSKHTGFMAAIEAQTPDLLEEIKGIAKGAALEEKLVLAYNLGEEIYSFCNRPIERCSNIAKENEEENLLAYNQDLPPFLHGDNQVVVLKHADYYAFAMPGSIGISGVSKHMAISCNSLSMLQMNENGLPLSFALRKLLAHSNLSAARTFLENTPLAVAQNLLMVSREGILGLEVSKNEVAEQRSKTNPVFLSHTNFPLVNADFKQSDYQRAYCPRFHFLDSIVQHFPPKQDYTGETMLNWISERDTYPVLNDETYLQFIAIFPKNSEKSPSIHLINPKKNGADLLLSFIH